LNTTLDIIEELGQNGTIVHIPGISKVYWQFILQDVGFGLLFGMLLLIALFIIVRKVAR
tara:strand:- start:1355 stop:1531 length:177 start_codon:yes stop_codon:yes gene_type:complete